MLHRRFLKQIPAHNATSKQGAFISVFLEGYGDGRVARGHKTSYDTLVTHSCHTRAAPMIPGTTPTCHSIINCVTYPPPCTNAPDHNLGILRMPPSCLGNTVTSKVDRRTQATAKKGNSVRSACSLYVVQSISSTLLFQYLPSIAKFTYKINSHICPSPKATRLPRSRAR